MTTVPEDADSLDMSPGTWQQVLDSFYGNAQQPVCEAPDKVLPQKMEKESRIGLVSETIDPDKYREFMRGL